MRKLKNILFFSSILLFFAFNFQGNPPQGWYLQTLPVNDQINDLFFLDSLNGWSVTAGNTNANDTAYILHTTNGGDNWSIQFAQPLNLTKIQFTDNNTGYAGGGTGSGTKYLYKTTNGGTNWNRILGSSGVGTLINDIQFINADTGWYSDDDIFDGSLFKTTNGGVNWVRQLNETYNIYALDFPSRDTGYAINSSNVYKTTNGGVNWSLHFAYSGILGSEIKFLNVQTGWVNKGNASSARPEIFKTTNGGINWFIQYGVPANDSILSPLFDKLHIINKDTIWAIGGTKYLGQSRSRGLLFLSTDGGTNWGYQMPDTNINVYRYTSIFFTDKKKGWAAGGFLPYKLAHTKIGGNDSTYYITGINSPMSEVPKNFTLFQNYPNPFNPSTIINYQLSINSFVTLRVYDLNGREIQKLVDKKQAIGNYSVQFNASNLSSGIYFYTIQINNGKEAYRDTKKMILVK